MEARNSPRARARWRLGDMRSGAEDLVEFSALANEGGALRRIKGVQGQKWAVGG